MAPNADWLEDFLQLLEDQSIGEIAKITAGTWGLFKDNRPLARQTEVLVAYRGGGTPPAGNIPQLRRCTITIQTTADKSDPEAGRAKQDEVYNKLAGFFEIASSTGRTFDWILCLSHPQYVGLDENGNLLYSSLYEVQLKEEVS